MAANMMLSKEAAITITTAMAMTKVVRQGA